VKKKQSQSGSAHLIIIILLAIALIGTLGFVYYQNFIQKKDSVVVTDDMDSADDTVIEADVNEGYLVLDDWDVKFKLQSDLGSNVITYQKDADSSWDDYKFSTERVSALGSDCAYLNRLIRSNETVDTTYGGLSLVGYFGGYYYYSTHRVDPCSDLDTGTTHTDIVFSDLTMLGVLLAGVEAE